MYKVAIIDDEPLVCRRLAEKVDWKEWDCTVCGTGSNGFEGIELIDRTSPDMVITDVKMPGMDGLHLADYIHHHYPHIITIILSGYNDFDYAREALRHHVFDYLLKPIDKDDFSQAMHKAMSFLHQRMDTTQPEQTPERRNEVSPFIESGLLMDYMLNNNHKLKSSQEIVKKLSSTVHKGQVIVYDLLNAWEQNKVEQNRSLYQFAINNILQEIYQRHRCGVHVIWIADKCVIVAKFDASMPSSIARERVLEATKEGAEQVKTYFKTKAFWGMGMFFNRIDELYSSYQSAHHSLANHLFWNLEFHEAEQPPSLNGVVTIEKTLYKWINEGNEAEADNEIDRLADKLRKARNIDNVYSVSLEILIHLNNMTREWDVQVHFPTLNDIKQHSFYEDLIVELRQIIEGTCRAIAKKRLMIHSPLMDKIMLFVKDHYDDVDMSLQFVADRFHLSTSHLSRFFKKEIGLNFNEFLTQERIEQAKRLMEEKYWLTSQELAYQVGFTDGKYFGQVFKKYCGSTPTEYRGRMTDTHNKE
jgi:two-component system response regulator YesN